MPKKKKVESVAKEIENFVEAAHEMEADAAKFDNGTKAAAARLRKQLQALRKECQRLRQLIQEIKTTM